MFKIFETIKSILINKEDDSGGVRDNIDFASDDIAKNIITTNPILTENGESDSCNNYCDIVSNYVRANCDFDDVPTVDTEILNDKNYIYSYINKKYNIQDAPYTGSCELNQQSEQAYIEIVQGVVNFSKDKLNVISKQKDKMRQRLIDFCLQIVIVQLFILFLLLVCGSNVGMSDKVIITFMTAVFVETLGAIIIMMRYAFKSDEEVSIIDILNAVVGRYQKYHDNENTDKDKDKK